MKRYVSTTQFKDTSQNQKSNQPVIYRNTVYPAIPISLGDTYVETEFSDRLDILANAYYGDQSLWWIIAIANPDKISFDSLSLTPGLQIRIPINHTAIVQAFNKINKGDATIGNIPDVPLLVSSLVGTGESSVGSGGGGY